MLSVQFCCNVVTSLTFTFFLRFASFFFSYDETTKNTPYKYFNMIVNSVLWRFNFNSINNYEINNIIRNQIEGRSNISACAYWH